MASRRRAGRAGPVPAALLDQIVRTYAPQRVVLFGSAARGESGPDTDLDLLVVLDDDAPARLYSARTAHAARIGYDEPVDILPVSASRFAEKSRVPGSLVAAALREGRTVYVRRT
jgi:uncharacterized protein